MNNASLPAFGLDLVIKNISKLPSPSLVVAELLHTIDQDDSSPTALAKSISKHQSLVARMLRMANSSFYGMPGRVENISDAIAVLGLRTVRTLAITTGLHDGYSALSAPGFDLDNFWRHSVATALGASSLARRMTLREGSAFVAGLLHDVGRLVLVSNFPAHFAAVQRYQTENGGFIFEAEQAIIGMDHAHIGRLLGERWHFPLTICDGIANHHHPDAAGSSALAGIVHIADALAHALDLASNPTEMVPCISQPSWRRADLSWQDSQEIFAEIEHEFGALCSTAE